MHVGVGQPRVRLHQHGLIGIVQNFLHDGQQFARPQRAVHAHGVRQRGSRQGVAGGVAAGKGAAVFFKGHRTQHGQFAVLARRQQRRPQLLQVRHRLDEHEVRPRPRARLHRAGEDLIRLFKREGAHGLEQHADGADVQRYKLAGRRLFGKAHACLDELFRPLCRADLLFIGAEGIRRDHVRPRRRVGAVDVGGELRLRQVDLFGHGAHARAAFLHHGAEGAVKHGDILLQKCSEVHRSVPRAAEKRGLTKFSFCGIL